MTMAGCLCTQLPSRQSPTSWWQSCRVRRQELLQINFLCWWNQISYEALYVFVAAMAPLDLTLEEKTWDGDTALILASEAGSADNVRILLEHRASPHNTNSRNESPLLIGRKTQNSICRNCYWILSMYQNVASYWEDKPAFIGNKHRMVLYAENFLTIYKYIHKNIYRHIQTYT